MNITPYLPSPYPQVSSSDRSVNAVRPTSRTRDAIQDDEQNRPVPQPTPGPQRSAADVGARAEALVRPYDPAVSSRANRALESYSQVAAQGERANLQTLLGFDDFA